MNVQKIITWDDFERTLDEFYLRYEIPHKSKLDRKLKKLQNRLMKQLRTPNILHIKSDGIESNTSCAFKQGELYQVHLNVQAPDFSTQLNFSTKDKDGLVR